MQKQGLLPENWDAELAGQAILKRLVNVTGPGVKGAHDSDFALIDGRAYIVYMANDVQPGESAAWPYVYCALSIVDLKTMEVEKTVTYATSEKMYSNITLAKGACFVPRIVRRNTDTLRCFFASEDPGARQSQMWFIDYDLSRSDFVWDLHRAEIATDQGIFPMQPQFLHDHLKSRGIHRDPVDYGLYMIDGFKRFDGDVYCVLNNFASGQQAWTRLDNDMTRFIVLGDFSLPLEAKLTESSVNRLPDGSWIAISRQENRDRRCMFSTSPDGRTWSPHEYRDVVSDGTNSKPVLSCFGGVYYLGWNGAAQVNGVDRSTFNLAVSRDGESWELKYHIATDESFQYATLHEADGIIYVSVTQGDTSDCRKERVMFGVLGEI